MEYRRRYFRRFGNPNQEEKPQNNLEQNQKEEKVEPLKNEKKVNNQNVYLQKVLQKTNNVPNPTTISINTVQESLPSFKNNIHDILSTDENKQKAIKYVIHKRNEGKKGKLQINTENEQEESNPVLANRYTHYQNRANNNNTKAEVYNKYTNINNKKEKENEERDLKPSFSHYYARRTKPSNNNKEQNEQKEPIENNNENMYRGRKIQVSVSTNNILTNFKNSPKFEKDEKIPVKRERYYNINSYRNNNANNIKETEEPKPRYKYLRGYVKRFEDEQKDNDKEKEKENDLKNNQSKEININLGKNFSFGIKDLISSNKSFGNQSSSEVINFEDINKFRGYKYFKVVKNNFELGKKNKKDIYNKKFAFNRQKEKFGDNKKGIVKDNVIDFKLLGNNNSNVNANINTEAPVSRFRRKYGRFTSNPENTNNNNLSFKDENELIAFINKKYNQDKILELFKIKPAEETKPKKDMNMPTASNQELKELREQLNEEKRKNEEKDKKLKQLESNISEQTNEIRDKNIGIGKKIQEIDKLKNDITSYKKDLQAKEKENIKLKNELDQTIKTEGNKQNKLKEELNKIKVNHDTLTKENEKIVKDYDELLKEHDKTKKDYNELLKNFESLQNKSDELSEIKKTKEELDINYNSIKEENSNLKNEIETLKNDFNINKEELEKYRSENDKLKGEMSIVNNLNDKLIEENGKLKEEHENINNDLEKNKQQNQELNKTKDKYYKLLDDYKQLTRDCNILRDEKTSIQIEQKQTMNNYKNLQEEYAKLKNDYDKTLEELNNFKNKEQTQKTLSKKQDVKTIDIEKIEKDVNLNENLMSKTLVIDKPKRGPINLIEKENKESYNDTQKVSDINNVISDVNNNITDLINKINKSDSNKSSAKKEQKDSNVKFNIKEENDNKIKEIEKNKLDEEKRNMRLSKAMLRIKKKQESNNNENNSQLRKIKSLKVQDLIKELENNMRKRDVIEEEKEEVNGGTEVQVENGGNFVNVLENQQLTKSMRKKKKAKTFEEEEN